MDKYLHSYKYQSLSTTTEKRYLPELLGCCEKSVFASDLRQSSIINRLQSICSIQQKPARCKRRRSPFKSSFRNGKNPNWAQKVWHRENYSSKRRREERDRDEDGAGWSVVAAELQRRSLSLWVLSAVSAELIRKCPRGSRERGASIRPPLNGMESGNFLLCVMRLRHLHSAQLYVLVGEFGSTLGIMSVKKFMGQLPVGFSEIGLVSFLD